MARYWLGPWEWESADGAAYWRAPLGADPCLDLRSVPACGTRTVSGFGLFTSLDSVDLGSSYENLGTDLQGAWGPSTRNRWRSALRLPETIQANNLLAAIWETFTVQSDPSGEDRAKPLVPSGRWYELWLSGQRIRSKEFSLGDPEATPLLDLLQRDYRTIRAESLAVGDERHYRKVLGYLVRKYRIGYRAFQPADVPDEEPLSPETTWTESWPTDGTTITTGQDQPWTEQSGDTTITSGTARHTTGSCRCDTALSGSDNYCQAVYSLTSTGTTRLAGPSCRYAAASYDCYAGIQAGGASGNGTFRPYKVVTAVLTALGTGGSQAQAATKKISASGTTIEIYQNGASVESITDSTHSVGVRCGLSWSNSLTTVQAFDSVEAADLAAPSGNRRRRVLVAGSRA
jgi:hypothetical protein